MRVASSSSSDFAIQQSKISVNTQSAEIAKTIKPSINTNEQQSVNQTSLENQTFDTKDKEAKVDEAINSINEFLEINHKSSKFVKHEGLEKYYVRLVDSETEEVIKEIPPERLLDAFYEMQKLLGMIVDEKI